MVEYITEEERNKVFQDHPRVGQRSKHSDWRGRMEKLQAGDTLVLYPTDNKNALNLAQTARQYGWKLGIKLSIEKLPATDFQPLRLFIWIPTSSAQPR